MWRILERLHPFKMREAAPLFDAAQSLKGWWARTKSSALWMDLMFRLFITRCCCARTAAIFSTRYLVTDRLQ
jgi:hypothetical protein